MSRYIHLTPCEAHALADALDSVTEYRELESIARDLRNIANRMMAAQDPREHAYAVMGDIDLGISARVSFSNDAPTI